MKAKYLKSEKGLTLIEIIVTLAIVGIILSVVYSFYLFGDRIFNKGMDQYNVQNNIRQASDYITGQIRYAEDITIMDSIDSDIITDPLNNMTDAYGNYIYYDGEKIVRLSKYSSNTFIIGTGGGISFSSDVPGEILKYTLDGKDSQQTYSIESEVKPLNLSLEGNSINTDAPGPVIFYRTVDNYLALKAEPEATLNAPLTPVEANVNFSKRVISCSVIDDNNDGTQPVSNITRIDNYNVKITIDSPGAVDGRIITFTVLLDDNITYEYTVSYSSTWHIE